jgi:hypothetical protein
VNSRRPVTTWLASASDSDLLEPRPSHLRGRRSAGNVMTILLDEQIHHGAEIALLRDLYRRFGAGSRPPGRSLEGGLRKPSPYPWYQEGGLTCGSAWRTRAASGAPVRTLAQDWHVGDSLGRMVRGQARIDVSSVECSTRCRSSTTRSGRDTPTRCSVHVVLKWGMTPAGVPRGEPLVQIGGLGVHLRLSRPAYNDIAEQRHPTSGTEHVVRSPPADRRVDPVPRRRRDEDIEASTTVVPLLERRRLDVDVGEAADSMAGECGHLRARLDGGH